MFLMVRLAQLQGGGGRGWLGDSLSSSYSQAQLPPNRNLKSSAGGGRTSLAVQWLRLLTSTAGAVGSIPGQGTKMPCGTAKKKKKQILRG